MSDLINCPDCEGTGIVSETRIVPVCCGNFNEDGGCCNYPIPDYQQEPAQCARCQYTGRINKNEL